MHDGWELVSAGVGRGYNPPSICASSAMGKGAENVYSPERVAE